MQKKEAILTTAIIVIAIYTVSVSLVSQAFPAMQTTKTLSSSGTIQTIGVGVYTDSSCTHAVTSIPWGTLEPGASQTFTCYIRNEGNGPSTFSLDTDNWSPAAASSYLGLGWNYGGQTLNAGQGVTVTLTLTVSASIQGITTFSFDIIIVGSS
jgi:hypothetical protein